MKKIIVAAALTAMVITGASAFAADKPDLNAERVELLTQKIGIIEWRHKTQANFAQSAEALAEINAKLRANAEAAKPTPSATAPVPEMLRDSTK